MEKFNENGLVWLDYLVLLIYFGVLLGIGIWSSYKSRTSTVEGFFLASRSMNWLFVGGSLFASNIGSGHFIGLAGSGASTGIAICGFELMAIFSIMLLGWVFVPVYLSSESYTMPQYLKMRFGGQRIRLYLAILALILYTFTKISTDIYAGGLFIKSMLKLEGEFGLYLAIIILLGFATLFTAFGGLQTVVVIDFWQTLFMIGGSLVLTITAFYKIGGYGQLAEKYMKSEPEHFAVLYDHNNVSCSAVRSDSMHLIRSPSSEDLPWTGLIFGVMVQSIWYWCADQVLVQRALSAKSLTHVKGCVLTGYLKFLPMWLIVFPGMIARILYTNEIACSNPEYCFKICGSRAGCSNIAYIELVINLLKPGLSGLLLAVMMGTLLSNLCSIFNSSSTIFAIDIWTRIRKNPSNRELLIVGKLSVILMLIISIVWVPVLKELNSSQLWIYTQSVSNYLAPPISALFILALFNSRTNEMGAFWGLICGFVIGISRFALEIIFPKPSCGSLDQDTRNLLLKHFVDFHHLHFGCVLFIICITTTLIISYLTKPIEPEKLYRLTFQTRHNQNIRQPIDTDQVNDEEKRGFANSPNNPFDYNGIPREQSPPTLCEKFGSFLSSKSSQITTDSYQMQTNDGDANKISPQQKAINAAVFLQEKQFWKRFVNSNAVVLIIVAISIWANWA